MVSYKALNTVLESSNERLNRTFMELKYRMVVVVDKKGYGLNRTFMELKYECHSYGYAFRRS